MKKKKLFIDRFKVNRREYSVRFIVSSPDGDETYAVDADCHAYDEDDTFTVDSFRVMHEVDIPEWMTKEYIEEFGEVSMYN